MTVIKENVFYFSAYRVVISTGFSGTTDKVSVILVGQGGAETGVHVLPGPFDRKRQDESRVRVVFNYLKLRSPQSSSFN